MASVSFGKFAKRRNSTKQPASLSDTRTVTLKESCSQDRPVFICTGNDFDYNYCMWNNKYYFIDEIVSLHNNLIEIHCIMDPLATYKTAITSSTQFVSYSASATADNYLIDSRIPVKKNAIINANTASMSSVINSNGFYVVTVIGKEGCAVYAMDQSTIKSMIHEISNWQNDGIIHASSLIDSPPGTPTDIEHGLADLSSMMASLGEALVDCGFVGNAYSQAPSCIRSCIWVPFFATPFVDTGEDLYLGNFRCGTLHPFILKGEPVTGTITVNIPWHFTGWRRAHCEDIYLYLPLVGMIALSSDTLVGSSSLSIKYSATATDGVISYEVKAGDQVIGTYGGQCSANYPIGISQQASAGQIAQTAFAGVEKTVNCAINSSLSPVSAGAAAVGAALTGTEAVYNLANITLSRNNSCIGGVGGGAGSGLDLDIICYSVAHDTVVTPTDVNYVATMGVPVMKAMSLSGLTGYCQCANAHVEADATAGELNAIDAMLNSGFYIE